MTCFLDLKTSYEAGTNASDIGKIIKNLRKQNCEDEANNIQLDKADPQQSNMNSKYLSVTLV